MDIEAGVDVYNGFRRLSVPEYQYHGQDYERSIR
jgi:hypothetical protein